MPDPSLSVFRRSLGDERGMALPFALGLTMVLSALAAGIFAYVTTNQGAATAPAGRPARVRAGRERAQLRAVAAAERRRPDQPERRAVHDGDPDGRIDDVQRLADRHALDAHLRRGR